MYLLLYLQLSKTSLSLVFVTVYFDSEVLRVNVTAFVLVIHSTELKKKQEQKTKSKKNWSVCRLRLSSINIKRIS